MDKQAIINIIKKMLSEYGVKRVSIFGSFARKEKFNDIDLLIDPPKGFSLLDLSALANKLEETTGFKIDIVTRKGLSPHLKKYIEKEAVSI